MAHYSNACDFIDPACRPQMSERFVSVFDCVAVDLEGGARSQLRIRASSVGDWWFSWLEGRGGAVVSADRRALHLTDHAMLTLSLGGHNHGLKKASLVPASGEIALHCWDDVDAVISSGDFAYVCAYIPLQHLEAIAPPQLPFGRVIDADRGAGAILSASLRALVAESLRDRDPRPLANLLPDFARLAVSALGNGEPLAGEASAASPRLQRLIDCMEAHLANSELSPARLAALADTSQRQLYREFQQAGDSFEDRLRRLRLNKAQRLLRLRPQASITQIAYDCGFTCPTSFGRAFRAAFDTTPKAFRLASQRTQRERGTIRPN